MKTEQEIIELMQWKRREAQRRLFERNAERLRQEAAFQKELEERADGKPFWLWKRPWEC